MLLDICQRVVSYLKYSQSQDEETGDCNGHVAFHFTPLSAILVPDGGLVSILMHPWDVCVFIHSGKRLLLWGRDHIYLDLLIPKYTHRILLLALKAL